MEKMNSKFLSKFSILIVFSLNISFTLFGQCYENITELSGLDITGFQSELETAACNLINYLPEEYHSHFKVYDMGYYLHKPHMQGSQAVIDALVSDISSGTPYYLLFAKKSGSSGLYSKIHVVLNLPNGGDMICAKGAKLDGLNNELQRIMDSMDSPYEFANKEIEVMERLGEFIQQVTTCCNPQTRRAKNSTLLDSTLLTINLCIDNSCQNDPSGSVALISSSSFPSMPQIAFKLNYPDTLCTSIKAELEIKYARTVDVANRSRDDVQKVIIEDVELEYEYVFNLTDIFMGGRAVIKFIDDVGSEIKRIGFTIKGLNPTGKNVFDYMDKKGYTNGFWFMKKMAYAESGSPNIALSQKMEHFNRLHSNRENLEKDWNAFSRCPKAMGDPYNPTSTYNDGGWGIFQLTELNNGVPSKESLWNWQMNVDDAYELIGTKRDYFVIPKSLKDVDLVNKWNNLPINASNQVERIDTIYGGITWKLGPSSAINNASINGYFTDVLADSDRSFLDACIMLAFNGYGGNKVNGVYRNFIYSRTIDWSTNNSKKPFWVVLDNSQTYVKKLSQKTVPKH